MSLFDEYYKKSTGTSKSKGAVKGLLDDIKFKVNGIYLSLKNNARRRNALLITSSVLALFLLKKDYFESKSDAFVEWREDRALRREERRVSGFLDEAEQKIYVLESEIFSLYSEKDSLFSVVSDLRSRVGVEHKNFEREVYPLREALDSLVDLKNSLRSSVSSYSGDVSSLRSQENNLRSSISDLRRRSYQEEQRYKSAISSLEKEVNELSVLKESLEETISSYSDKIAEQSPSRRNVVSRVLSSSGSSSSSGDYWIIMPSGGSLSWAASKYHGSANLYDELAKINNIDNPNFVYAGQPIKLLSSGLSSFKNVRSDPVPDFVMVNRNESVEGFINRVNVNVSVDDLISYNSQFGNNFPRDRFPRNIGVVYLDESWSNGRSR